MIASAPETQALQQPNTGSLQIHAKPFAGEQHRSMRMPLETFAHHIGLRPVAGAAVQLNGRCKGKRPLYHAPFFRAQGV